MEQASTQSYRNFEPSAPKWRRIAHHVWLCREAFVDSFRIGRLQKFDDELVRNGLSLVETRVSSTLGALRRRGTVLIQDAHRSACRHITHSMVSDPGLREELAALESLPLDRRSVRLHLAAFDRGITRELPALVSVLSGDTCAAESEDRSSRASVPDSLIRYGRARCRHYRRDNSEHAS